MSKRARDDDAPSNDDVDQLRETERKLQQQLTAQRRKESSLVLRLAQQGQRDDAVQEQLLELRRALHPAQTQAESLLLDPAVNAEIRRLREQVKEAEAREKEAQAELEASQFSAGSLAGKKLMQKCKDLQTENEQLGKELSDGRLQKLRAEVAMHKEVAHELGRNLSEAREWAESLLEELETVSPEAFARVEAATEAAFADGWFRSGDLAVVHPSGYAEIKDRAKDIIISGGENISTVEVESSLYRHAAVLEASVVARPDEKWGEVPCAFVVLKEGERWGDGVDEAAIIAHCRAQMAHFKAPKHVVHLPEGLPKTSTGKVQKFELRERARAM